MAVKMQPKSNPAATIITLQLRAGSSSSQDQRKHMSRATAIRAVPILENLHKYNGMAQAPRCAYLLDRAHHDPCPVWGFLMPQAWAMMVLHWLEMLQRGWQALEGRDLRAAVRLWILRLPVLRWKELSLCLHQNEL